MPHMREGFCANSEDTGLVFKVCHDSEMDKDFSKANYT